MRRDRGGCGVIKGVAKEDEGTLDVELDMTGTTWRSVKTGMDCV